MHRWLGAAAAAAATPAAAPRMLVRTLASSPIAVTLIMRHGDRSPTFNALEPLVGPAAEEAATWLSSLPTQALARDLDQRFPSDAAAKQRDDSLGRPFGSLTSLGVLQMRRLGGWAADLFSEPAIAPVRCLSSNFRRTQLSAKCFLAGLARKLPNGGVGTAVSSAGQELLNVWGIDPTLKRLIKANGLADVVATTDEEKQAREVMLKCVPAFGFNIRPFSWLSALDHTMCREGKTGGGGPLRGRPVSNKIHEVFPLVPKQANKFLRADLKDALNKVLMSPGTSELDEFLGKIPMDGEGLMTGDAFRAFVQSLRLPGPPPGASEEEFWDAAAVVERAVCKRFDAILSYPKIGSIAAGGVARRVSQGLATSLAGWRLDGLPRVEVFSAHDVTLVPLNKALGLWDQSHPWPGLASTLAIQLFAAADGSSPYLKFMYWSGVRGAKSGLEPAPLAFDLIHPALDSVVDSKDKTVDFEHFVAWSKLLR